MKVFFSNLIPKIRKFSKRLDDLTRLADQHWVLIDDSDNKTVFIFKADKQLFISENSIVERGRWDYLGNQSILIETPNESYLFKHGFLDKNVLALKPDGAENAYAFFINENLYPGELNTIEDIVHFLKNTYSDDTKEKAYSKSFKKKGPPPKPPKYRIVDQRKKGGLVRTSIVYTIEFYDGKIGKVYSYKKNMFYYIEDKALKWKKLNAVMIHWRAA